MRITEETTGFMIHYESSCPFLVKRPIPGRVFADGCVEEVPRNIWYAYCRKVGEDANKIIDEFRKTL